MQYKKIEKRTDGQTPKQDLSFSAEHKSGHTHINAQQRNCQKLRINCYYAKVCKIRQTRDISQRGSETRKFTNSTKGTDTAITENGTLDQ